MCSAQAFPPCPPPRPALPCPPARPRPALPRPPGARARAQPDGAELPVVRLAGAQSVLRLPRGEAEQRPPQVRELPGVCVLQQGVPAQGLEGVEPQVDLQAEDLKQECDLDLILTERSRRCFDPTLCGVQREACLLVAVETKHEERTLANAPRPRRPTCTTGLPSKRASPS